MNRGVDHNESLIHAIGESGTLSLIAITL